MSQLQASHLLIKHEGSRNPVSRRTGESTSHVSRAAAIAEAEAWATKIKNGELTFADAALQRSDCSSFKRGGDLGPFGPGQMMEPFEKATLALEVGQMSGEPLAPEFPDAWHRPRCAWFGAAPCLPFLSRWVAARTPARRRRRGD